MPFTVVYDAVALYPNAQRDLLIRIAQHGLVQAKWTDQILDEMCRARLRRNPGLDPAKATRLRELMTAAVADCLVTGYEPLIDGLKLPDPDDRHVLAAAIKASAQVIVTANLKHFPAHELGKWDMEPKSPDDFVLDQISIDDRVVFSCVQEIANSRRRPPQTVSDVLAELENVGLVASAAALRSPPLPPGNPSGAHYGQTAVVKTLTYHGDPARAGALVQMLEQRGVEVEWSPPVEHRGLGTDANEVSVNLVSTGSALAIAAAVRQFRQRFPRHKVEVEGEPDDNGSQDD